jgi:hypothetical protein
METMNTDTPETDQAESNKAKIAFASLFPCDGYDHARKLERERDEARADAAMWKSNHDNQVSLKSMLMDRPDLGDRALRIAELIRERDELREALETGGLLDILDRAGHNRAEAIRERDEAREDLKFKEKLCAELTKQLREEQRLHVQTLNERDEARQWESQALVARIQRDRVSKTLGEVREILCDAMPNENAPTSFMAATLVKERDEAQKQLLNLWKP